MAQWLRLFTSNAGYTGSVPCWGAKISIASWPKNQSMKQKQYCDKFNKDFKNDPHQKRKLKKKNRHDTFLLEVFCTAVI